MTTWYENPTISMIDLDITFKWSHDFKSVPFIPMDRDFMLCLFVIIINFDLPSHHRSSDSISHNATNGSSVRFVIHLQPNFKF